MPTSNDPLDPVDPCAGGSPQEPPGSGGIPVSILARTAARRRTALSWDAVLWLNRRAGGMFGRYGDIPLALHPAFALQIDESQPVAVLRAHLERASFGDRSEGVVVALCSFASRLPGAPRVLNELVCRPDDYVRVAHGATELADWTRWEFDRLRELSGDGTDPPPPVGALPEGTTGVVRPDGSVELGT